MARHDRTTLYHAPPVQAYIPPVQLFASTMSWPPHTAFRFKVENRVPDGRARHTKCLKQQMTSIKLNMNSYSICPSYASIQQVDKVVTEDVVKDATDHLTEKQSIVVQDQTKSQIDDRLARTKLFSVEDSMGLERLQQKIIIVFCMTAITPTR